MQDLQRAIDASRTQLAGLQNEVRIAQGKLARLQDVQQEDEQSLAQRLVGAYETGRPDLVSVVLEAGGFDDLLERLAFARRIAAQDAQIVGRVQAARRAVALQATRVGGLSIRQQRAAAQELSELTRMAEARTSLASRQRATAAQPSAGRQASSTQPAADLRAAGAPGASGSAFGFPMPRGDVSPPATWSLGDGVDIAAPGGTPELAVCAGTVVLHGVGGLGPSTPVLHCDRPLAGYDYVYYGDAGPGSWTPTGTHLKQGQELAEVGVGTVGDSSGPHLKTGFANVSGSPLGPASAARMLGLLNDSYRR